MGIYEKYDEWRMEQLKVPTWFDRGLVNLLKKKYDRSDMAKYERTLDWFVRQNLKITPTLFTGIVTAKYNWADIENIIEENCRGIKKTGYKPDVIIGVKSGGAFIANYVGKCLDNDNVTYMRITHYSANSRSVVKSTLTCLDKKAQVAEEPDIDLRGKKVLLVDDQTGTGATLEAGHEYFKDKGLADLKTFCLYTRKGVHVDFCSREGMMMYTPWGKDA